MSDRAGDDVTDTKRAPRDRAAAALPTNLDLERDDHAVLAADLVLRAATKDRNGFYVAAYAAVPTIPMEPLRAAVDAALTYLLSETDPFDV